MPKTSDEIDHAAPKAPDPLAMTAVLPDVVKKLSSQSLLFGLAAMVLILAGWYLFGTQGAVAIVIIFLVFALALSGYLFVESRRGADSGGLDWIERSGGGAASSAGAAARDFAIELWTAPAGAGRAASRDIGVVPDAAGAYRIGDPIVINFRATRDCYLTLLNLGTSGRLTVLFPNARQPDNFVGANRLYAIPDSASGFEFRLQGPPGTERLKAIATLSKVTLLESQFTAEGALFDARSASAAPRDIAAVERGVAALKPADWAEATARFAVEG
jgi:hypothetical protein